MAAADYALCGVCSKKVFYDADTDIPDGTVVLHPGCMAERLAAVEALGYARAVAALRDVKRYERWWTKLQPDHPEYGYWELGREQLAHYLETVGGHDGG